MKKDQEKRLLASKKEVFLCVFIPRRCLTLYEQCSTSWQNPTRCQILLFHILMKDKLAAWHISAPVDRPCNFRGKGRWEGGGGGGGEKAWWNLRSVWRKESEGLAMEQKTLGREEKEKGRKGSHCGKGEEIKRAIKGTLREIEIQRSK